MNVFYKTRAFVSVIILYLLYAGPTAAVDSDPCDGLSGKAMGLCIAATQGMKCNTSEPSGSDSACRRIEQKLTEITGTVVPWVCPTFSTESIVFAFQSHASDIDNLELYNTTGIYSDDLTYINFEGKNSENIYVGNVMVAGLSSSILPGEYLARVTNSTNSHRTDTISESQQVACRTEIKNAFTEIKSIACPDQSLCLITVWEYDDTIDDELPWRVKF